jgi:regulatory protein
MPRITNIARQKKREQLYSIFIDDVFSFSLADLELSMSGLRVGQELTEQEVTDWRERSLLGKAVGRAQYYLSFRARTVHEVRKYLTEKDFDTEIVDSVTTKLTANGQLNDEQFALDWIRMRQGSTPRSKRELQNELRKVGVPADIIDIALMEAEETATGDVGAIVDLINKKRLRQRYPEEKKLIEYLGRKGFGYHDIRAAFELLEEA